MVECGHISRRAAVHILATACCFASLLDDRSRSVPSSAQTLLTSSCLRCATRPPPPTSAPPSLRAPSRRSSAPRPLDPPPQPTGSSSTSSSRRASSPCDDRMATTRSSQTWLGGLRFQRNHLLYTYAYRRFIPHGRKSTRSALARRHRSDELSKDYLADADTLRGLTLHSLRPAHRCELPARPHKASGKGGSKGGGKGGGKGRGKGSGKGSGKEDGKEGDEEAGDVPTLHSPCPKLVPWEGPQLVKALQARAICCDAPPRWRYLLRKASHPLSLTMCPKPTATPSHCLALRPQPQFSSPSPCSAHRAGSSTATWSRRRALWRCSTRQPNSRRWKSPSRSGSRSNHPPNLPGAHNHTPVPQPWAPCSA